MKGKNPNHTNYRPNHFITCYIQEKLKWVFAVPSEYVSIGYNLYENEKLFDVPEKLKQCAYECMLVIRIYGLKLYH